MTAKEILAEMKPLGSEGYKRVIFNHGVREPCFGVKIGDLQGIQKRVRKDYQLALDLYDTGVYDAMYLAALVADDERMTRKDLQRWVDAAYCKPLCGSAVAWVAAGSRHGWEIGLEWIDSTKEMVAAAGWATLGSLVSIKDDSELDLGALGRLLARVQATIHKSPDPVRSQMNSFVIALGTHVAPLTQAALKAGRAIGPVTVDAGNTSCRVAYSPEHLQKAQKRGAIGRKRKSAKC